MITPSAFISALTFSDGTKLDFGRDDIVVLVGPNNVGKTVALKEIDDKAVSPKSKSLVITEVCLATEGSAEDLWYWLDTTCRKQVPEAQPDNPSYSRMGCTVHHTQASSWWQSASATGLNQLAHMFVYRLTTEARLQAAKPAQNIQLTTHPLTHPIHYMQVDDALETRISDVFRQALGQDLIVHRNAGSQVPLYCGTRPTPPAGCDRVSLPYVRELEQLPTLESQGDGMRAFVGILLHAFIVDHSAVLIDEPEAFLHPPQARLLGRLLAGQDAKQRQLFIATHSGDLLRGLLDANSTRVRIIRIERQGDINPVAELDNDGIRDLWNDPLLRYSNVLDGVFHERVVICEGDADCRFYAAIKDALAEADDAAAKDIMFLHCGGKDRIPVVARSLRHLGVPVTAVCDFDVINTEGTVKRIFETLGGQWEDVRADWALVKSAVDSKKPELQTEEVIAEITTLLDGVEETYFPKEGARGIQKILRRSSPWATAKTVGKSYIPSGDPTQACNRLFAAFQGRGLHVVDVGEMEGFCRSVGSHGPSWVNEVLAKDLAADPELEPARQFVRGIVSTCPAGT